MQPQIHIYVSHNLQLLILIFMQRCLHKIPRYRMKSSVKTSYPVIVKMLCFIKVILALTDCTVHFVSSSVVCCLITLNFTVIHYFYIKSHLTHTEVCGCNVTKQMKV